MDMQTFVMELDKLGYGVNFNTYHQNGVSMCYINASESGDSGKFIKRECPDFKLQDTLQAMFLELKPKK